MGRDQIKEGSISSPPTRMYDWDLLKRSEQISFLYPTKAKIYPEKTWFKF